MDKGKGHFRGLAGFGAALAVIGGALALYGFTPPPSFEQGPSWYLTWIVQCRATFAGDCVGHVKLATHQFDGAGVYAVAVTVALLSWTVRRLRPAPRA